MAKETASKFAGLAADIQTPIRIELVNPATDEKVTEKGNPDNVAWIEILSPDSDVARQFRREQQLKRQARRNPEKPLSPAEVEEANIAFYVALTTGWNLITLDGAKMPVEFSKANAKEFYAMPEVAWVRRQVDRAAGEEGRFMKASPQS